jgi:hypothetical protein
VASLQTGAGVLLSVEELFPSPAGSLKQLKDRISY